MKPSNQFCSLEQAKKLNELKINQTDAFYYFQWDVLMAESKVDFGDPKYAAFSVAELGAMLGKGYPSWQFKHPKEDKLVWICTRIGPNEPNFEQKYRKSELIPMYTYEVCDRYADTEVQARAALLIICIEVGMDGFTIEEVNERLKNA